MALLIAAEDADVGALLDALRSSAWRFQMVRGFCEGIRQLETGEFSAVVVRCGSEPADGYVRAVARAADHAPVVYVLPLEDIQTAREALRHGASCLPTYFIGRPEGREMLVELLDRRMREQSLGRAQQEAELQNLELMQLNRFYQAVAASLEPRAVVDEALRCVAAMYPGGEAALLVLERREPRSSSSGRADATAGADFDATLRKGLGCLKIAGATSETLREALEELPDDAPDWLAALRREGVRRFDEPSAVVSDPLPGIERLWGDVDEATIYVVPVTGQRRPIGLLVLRDTGHFGPRPRPETLQSVASRLGVAFENAWLFGKIRDAYDRLRRTQDQLISAEKFAAVGLLSAEIAHEINNPATFVITNLSVMTEYVETLGAFYDRILTHLEGQGTIDLETFVELSGAHDIAYLSEDLEKLVGRSLAGLERIHQIVQDLRFLTHEKSAPTGWVNVERLLQSSVNLVRHEAKYRTRVELDFADVPMVLSDASRLSQVFLNLLVNAVQAIEPGDPANNLVEVTTHHDDSDLYVQVRDTGTGMSAETLEQIFEPFFTTKEPGSGTGLGLSISRDIMRGLGGDILVESMPGLGSTFTIKLPLRPKDARDGQDAEPLPRAP